MDAGPIIGILAVLAACLLCWHEWRVHERVRRASWDLSRSDHPLHGRDRL